ncbi:MAG: hypothetical protein U5K53_03145 [Halanaerobiales bacterium]|nr:hypothetical protein [Halanaerobiales bacterium]
MNKLEQKHISLVEQYLTDNCRLLEKKLFDYHIKDADTKDVLFALKLYQNKDGGFGQGLESDFRFPDSSPMATSIGLRILSKLEKTEEVSKMIKKAVQYLESTYDEDRKGWYAVPKVVNDYPHTPWWHYDEDEKMTVIDKNWGNPTAELIAYLYKYRKYISDLDIMNLVEHAVNYIDDKSNFNSENEVFCFIKLYNIVPKKYQIRIKEHLSNAVSQVIEYDENKWEEYVPLPLHFIKTSDQFKFKIKEKKIQSNLDYYVKTIKEKTMIDPPWGKSFYKDGLRRAYEEWKGVLTLEALEVLNNFDRIKK